LKLPRDLDYQWVNRKDRRAVNSLLAREQTHIPREYTTGLVLFTHTLPSIPDEAIKRPAAVKLEELATALATYVAPPVYKTKDSWTAYRTKVNPPPYQESMSRVTAQGWLLSKFQRLQQKLHGHRKDDNWSSTEKSKIDR
jgi:hypothetical protein